MADSPDWPVIIGAIFGGIATIVTAIGGVLWMKNNKHEQAPPAERTLPEIWKLIDKLQEERTRCDERVGALEVEQRQLRAEFKALETELRESYRKNDEQ